MWRAFVRHVLGKSPHHIQFSMLVRSIGDKVMLVESGVPTLTVAKENYLQRNATHAHTVAEKLKSFTIYKEQCQAYCTYSGQVVCIDMHKILVIVQSPENALTLSIWLH